jgi:hypothetical protein
MDEDQQHIKFQADQTAAKYVANGVDESMQEAFELHLMNCTPCVEQVEVWRAIKLEMPAAAAQVRMAIPKRTLTPLTDWRLAACLIGVGVIGAAGGWLGQGLTSADLSSTQTVVFNLPSVYRGADECTGLRLARDTRLAIIRVPGISRDLRLVALDGERRELPRGQYTSRIQPDGSQLLQIESQLLLERPVHLEARRADGTSDPLGCLVAELSELR